MRYRVKKDFVLEGTLLAWGDSLFVQQSQGDKKDEWEVWSLFTRKLIGRMSTNDVALYLNEDENAPQGKYKKNSGGRSIKDISLVLALFILPLWGMSQGICHTEKASPVQWTTKMVQTGDDMFELHLSAKIDSSWFLYPLNERKRCDLCPILMLEKSNFWEAIGGPELYYYDTKILPDRCGSLPSPYCPVERLQYSVVYIQSIKGLVGQNCSIKGRIIYYPTSKDSVGQQTTLMFARSLYSTSEQPITKIVPQ